MAEFKGAGKVEGFQMWRIENFKAVKVAEITGKLHEGDSYIFLATIKKNNCLTWNLHFWLGKDTSQDESGSAAIKSIELDELLGGGPVQFREVQGSESSTFRSYFKKPINGKPMSGIEYLPGGVKSGFKQVERDVYRTRLLEVKGKRVARVREVPALTSSLKKDDAFVLDMGLEIFIFNGPLANRQEKMKATEVACHLDDNERGGRAKVLRIEDDPTNETFWGGLGGYVDPHMLPMALPDTDDDESFVNKLFLIKDGSTGIDFNEIASGRLSREMLSSDDVFLLHSRDAVFLWIGKTASRTEKRDCMGIAIEYMKKTGVAENTNVQKVPEGMEPGHFIKWFAVWAPKKIVKTVRAQSASDMTAEAAAFITRQAKEKQDDEITPAEESLKIWRVENFAAVEEAKELYGQFYSGDSYILLYTFRKTKQSKEESIIYFWQGLNSSIDEKGASAILAKDLDDKMGGSPVQCRVVQGKEPMHFRRIFKGQMIIHQGGVPSGFRKTDGSAEAAATEGPTDTLYSVRGSTPMTTIAKQVPCSGSAINSDDCFVLLTTKNSFLFKGRHSTSQEKAMAEGVAGTLAKGRKIIHVTEGAEPEAFWSALGGKVTYPEHNEGNEPAREPRLFLASNISGKFKVEEIEAFDQGDLNDDEVMLLDTFDEVFVWVGGGATIEEERLSKEFAKKYIEMASKSDGRSLSTATVVVQSGNEPTLYTRHFQGWDPAYREKHVFIDPYEAKLARLREDAAKAPPQALYSPVLRQVSSERKEIPRDTPELPKPALRHVDSSPMEKEIVRKHAEEKKPVEAVEKESTKIDLVVAEKPKTAASKKESEVIAAVKTTYDTGKLPPALAAKVDAKAEVGVSTTAPVTPDQYLPYEVLRDTKKPVGVDVERKEQYLEDEVFQKLFGMDKAKFVTLPKWKRDDQKRKLKLF